MKNNKGDFNIIYLEQRCKLINVPIYLFIHTFQQYFFQLENAAKKWTARCSIFDVFIIVCCSTQRLLSNATSAVSPMDTHLCLSYQLSAIPFCLLPEPEIYSSYNFLSFELSKELSCRRLQKHVIMLSFDPLW